MKIDRKWIVMAALLAFVLAPACAKKEPEVIPPPPPVTEKAPLTDVEPDTAPAGPVDPVEKKPEMSLQEAQASFEGQGLLGDVFYDFDKYDLRADARERLAKNADFMKSAEGSAYTFTIEGHCDERGTNEYNIALGQSRSTTAMDYIASLGVSRGRFKTISYGEERPFCNDSNEGCWQKNRRARFVITGRS
ncbi:MAG: OmpA family protein [bacterium]|nr:OmpA family protein [bacterium]